MVTVDLIEWGGVGISLLYWYILKVFTRSDAVGGVVRQKWKKYLPIVSENVLGCRTILTTAL